MYDLSEDAVTARLLPRVAPTRLKRFAMIGNFPPRRCGIATFTADLHAALTTADPNLDSGIVAMNDGAYDYPDSVSGQIQADALEDYSIAAQLLNASGADVVNVQHEYGIFGGPAGAHLLSLLADLRAPVVTTLHTILERPTEEQRRVMLALIQNSSRLVVMSRKGRDILARVYGAPLRKIDIIPHGAPDRPLVDADKIKPRFGLEGRDVLMTFGLLSPGKGIETAIRAMPRIVAARPNALYLVLGATHPHLLARDGETYREHLIALAEELGVADNVRFVNSYVGVEELIAYLSAADIYLTPYLNEAQITSGTLAYAVALGKPVVSTPYWHAAELLEGGAGVLTPFGDIAAISDAVADLLSDTAKRRALSRRAYERGRKTIWPRVAELYLQSFEAARAEARAKPARRPAVVPSPPLTAVERLTDGVGILQHARFNVPDRNHGYCVDDNARALILTQRAYEAGARGPALGRLASTYAAFVEHAWNPSLGRFRNFMSYDRAWLEEVGSEDSFGRAFWSLGETALRTRDPELRAWALYLAQRVTPHFAEIGSLRSIGFGALALCALDAAGVQGLRPMLSDAAEHIAGKLKEGRRIGWDWFEPTLAYDNARLPEALLRAALTLDAPALAEAGLDSLRWLTSLQNAPSGVFRPVGHESFGRAHAAPKPFDQQPLEAAATIDACWAAFDATNDPAWREEARRAFAWYLGENDLGVRLAIAETGGCYDGLAPSGPNRNQGAESVLSFQLAACAMRVRARARPAPQAC